MDPLTLAFAASAGIGLGRTLLGGGKESTNPDDYDVDPEGRALARYRQLMDPSYGVGQFDRMAGQAATGASTFNRMIAAQGGSTAQARELAERSQAQAGDQAFGAFRQFQTARESSMQGYLGMEQQRAVAQMQGVTGANQRNAERDAAFNNQLISLGLGALGMGMNPGVGGGGGNARMPGGAPMPSMRGTTPLDLVGAARQGGLTNDWIY